MGNADSTPGVSQCKSFVQVLAGDVDGARETQENFSKQCPVVAQMRSAVEATYDVESARKTQEEFLRETVIGTAEATPVLGHVAGAIHYATGNNERGDSCMKAASRSVALIAGGVAGGPVGAIAAGAVMDSTITAIDSAVHEEYRPYGIQKNVSDIVGGKDVIGGAFDLGIGLASAPSAKTKAKGLKANVSEFRYSSRKQTTIYAKKTKQMIKKQALPLITKIYKKAFLNFLEEELDKVLDHQLGHANARRVEGFRKELKIAIEQKQRYLEYQIRLAEDIRDEAKGVVCQIEYIDLHEYQLRLAEEIQDEAKSIVRQIKENEWDESICEYMKKLIQQVAEDFIQANLKE